MMDKRCVVRRLRCPECTLLGRVCRGAVSRPPPLSRLRCPRTHGKSQNPAIVYHLHHPFYAPRCSPTVHATHQSAERSRHTERSAVPPALPCARPTVPALPLGECRSAVCSHCVAVHSRGFRIQSAESGFRFQRVSALYSVCRAASNCRCYRQPPPRPRSAANS